MFVFKSHEEAAQKAAEWAAGKVKGLDAEINRLTSQKSQVRRRLVERRAAYADMHYLLTHYEIRNDETDRQDEVPTAEGANETTTAETTSELREVSGVPV